MFHFVDGMYRRGTDVLKILLKIDRLNCDFGCFLTLDDENKKYMGCRTSM